MKGVSGLHIVQSGGASLIHRSPLFSQDSRYLFCVSGNEVKVFSTVTGKCRHRLVGHEQEVTGVAQHPKIKLQIVSTSLDSTLRIWDYEDGVLVRTIKTGCPLHCLYSHSKFPEHVYVIQQKDDIYQLSRIPVKDIDSAGQGEAKPEVGLEALVNGIRKPLAKAVRFLSSGRHVVCCKKNALCIVNAKHPHSKAVDHISEEDGEITCVCCHPTDNCCVTGHTSGKIKFWHNVYTHKRGGKDGNRVLKVVESTQHWHRGYVDGICFTPGGSSILSVGIEGVLVQWHFMESGNKKNFFPRLGAPMRHIAISNDGALYATTHIDNSILILTNLFTIQQTIEGFTQRLVSGGSSDAQEKKQSALLPCNLQHDWKTRSCVTNGKPGHLLFYQPYTDTQLYNLDITHRNYVSGDTSSIVITNVGFSCANPSTEHGSTEQTGTFASSTWMATVEVLNGITTEQKLKVWIFDEAKQWWKLNTVVNDPHELSVTRLLFRPYSECGSLNPALLTTSLDGMAKLWTPAENMTGKSTGFWSCDVVASYRSHAVRDGDFSQDGSLAALGFENVVCLSDPDALEDMTVFLDLPKSDSIKRLLFGRHACEHYLMILTSGYLRACDILSGSCLWSVDMDASHIVRDPLSDVMAVFIEKDKNDLHIFRPCSPSPLYTHSDVTPTSVLGAAFFPCEKKQKNSWMSSGCKVEWMQKSRLFFVSSKLTVHTVCTEEELETRQSTPVYVKLNADNESKLQTPLASVLSKSRPSQEGAAKGQELSTTTALSHTTLLNALKQITDAPSHVMPPASTLCQTFLSSLLTGKSTGGEEQLPHAMDTKHAHEELEKEGEAVSLGCHEITLNRIDANSYVWATTAFRT